MYAHHKSLPGFLTVAECERLIRHAQRHYQPEEGVVGHGSGNRVKADKEQRVSMVRWLDYCDLDLLWFYRRLDHAVMRVNREEFGYQLQPSSTDLQFTEYHGEPPEVVRWRQRTLIKRLWDGLRNRQPPASEVAAGHYDWHADSSATRKAPMDRKLSVVVQLSDPRMYEGGGFEIAGDELAAGAFSKQGDALIFRSGLRHRVQPVTAGVRYSFVTWVHGPRA